MAITGSEPLPTGYEFCGYRLDGVLGKGGMGIVYKAIQLSLNRAVALKVINDKHGAKSHAVAEFIEEAQRAANLSHPNLVPVYDVGQDPASGVYFYSMQMIVARTLSVIVKQQGPMKWPEALAILRQVVAGIAYAHDKGLIHRDLKPDNVMVDNDGHVVVADLGLARDRFADKAATSKRVLRLVGTPEFSAPEQLRDPDSAVPASDVFSLGGLTYFMLTGEVPFKGVTLLDLVVSVAVDDPPLMGKIPEPARSLVAQMMAKDPDARPQDAQALLDLLSDPEGATGSRELPARTAAGGPTRRGGRPRVRRRRRR